MLEGSWSRSLRFQIRPLRLWARTCIYKTHWLFKKLILEWPFRFHHKLLTLMSPKLWSSRQIGLVGKSAIQRFFVIQLEIGKRIDPKKRLEIDKLNLHVELLQINIKEQKTQSKSSEIPDNIKAKKQLIKLYKMYPKLSGYVIWSSGEQLSKWTIQCFKLQKYKNILN